MPRTSSFDDNNVGKGGGEYFKITGTKTSPQRIAFIPGEAFEAELVVADALKAKAKAGDKEAQEKIEDISNLRENITKSMKKMPPSAEVWTNENGQKCMLYSKLEVAQTFYVEGAGYIYDKPNIPEECKGKYGAGPMYGFVIIEYEMGDDGPKLIPEEQQIDLGGGDRLRFRYSMKVAQMNDPKVRAWKEHTKNFPMIFHDYEVWTEKVGQSDRAKFSPCPIALWRDNPSVMKRIIAEARKLYPTIKKNLAKDFTREEVIKMFPKLEQQLGMGGNTNLKSSPQMEMHVEEADFSALLGGGSPPPAPTEPTPGTEAS